MFLSKNQGVTRVATNLPPFQTKKGQSNFWTAYGKCTCNSKIILSTIYPLVTFRYDPVSLSMTISHLQIAVFLMSHPSWPSAIEGGLDYLTKMTSQPKHQILM